MAGPKLMRCKVNNYFGNIMVFNRKSSFFGSFSLISFCNIEFAKREEEKIAFFNSIVVRYYCKNKADNGVSKRQIEV